MALRAFSRALGWPAPRRRDLGAGGSVACREWVGAETGRPELESGNASAGPLQLESMIVWAKSGAQVEPPIICPRSPRQDR